MCVPKKLPSGHHSVPLAPHSHDQKEAYECGAHETGAGAQGGKSPKFTRQTPLPPMKISYLQSYHPASQAVLVVNNPPANAGDTGSIPGLEDPLEKGMATHSSIRAWRTPWTEEPGGLQSIGSWLKGLSTTTHHQNIHHPALGKKRPPWSKTLPVILSCPCLAGRWKRHLHRWLCLPALSITLFLVPKVWDAANGHDTPPGHPLAGPEIPAICMAIAHPQALCREPGNKTGWPGSSLSHSEAATQPSRLQRQGEMWHLMSLVIEGVASQHMVGKYNTRNFGGHSNLSGSLHNKHIRRMQEVHDVINVGTAWWPIFPLWRQCSKADRKFPSN